jgi:hypothetical protein
MARCSSSTHDHFSHIVTVTEVRCSCVATNVISGSMETRKPSKHRSHASTSTDLTATRNLNRAQLGKRRSTRIALTSPVGLAGEDRNKSSFTMPATATNLNKHGAAVQLHRELQVGSIVSVKNKRGVQVSARVISQMVARQGVPTYAIEFVEQDDKAKDFWGISFPSAN